MVIENNADRVIRILSKLISESEVLKNKAIMNNDYVQAGARDSYISGLSVALEVVKQNMLK